VEGVGDECGELGADEPLELVSGGDAGAGGRTGGTAGGAGAGAVAGVVLVLVPMVVAYVQLSSYIEILVQCLFLQSGICRCPQFRILSTIFVL